MLDKNNFLEGSRRGERRPFHDGKESGASEDLRTDPTLGRKVLMLLLGQSWGQGDTHKQQRERVSQMAQYALSSLPCVDPRGARFPEAHVEEPVVTVWKEAVSRTE